MKILIKLFLGIFSFCLFTIFVGVVHGDVHAIDSVVTVKLKNNGDAQSTVTLTVRNATGTWSYPDTIVIPGFGSAARSYYDFGQNSPPYTVQWTAYKPLAWDPRDVNCKDPVTVAQSVPFLPGTTAAFFAYEANISFACWVPPAATITPATGLSQSMSCESSTSVRVNFSWTPASGTTFDAQWLDFAFVNPPDPGGFGFQNRNVGVGASSYAESGFVPNTPHYWKINSHATNGQWYPSTAASFTTPNCGQIGLLGAVRCSGNVSIVDLGWSTTAGGTQFQIFRNGAYFATATNTNQWSWNADVQGSQYNWQVVDVAFGKYSNTITLTTATCGTLQVPPSNLSATANCNGPGGTPQVNFSWKLGSVNQVWLDAYNAPILFTFFNKQMGVNQTVFLWNSGAPLSSGYVPQPGTTYYWRLWDGTSHVNGPNVTTSTCPTTNPVSQPPTPTCVGTGTILGSKWSETDNKAFDTANGLPGATVTLDGGSQTDGPASGAYTFTGIPCGNHTVSVNGVSGWQVRWYYFKAFTDQGFGPYSPAGSGTSYNFSIAGGQSFSVWFYFAKVATGGPTCSPSSTSAAVNQAVTFTASGGNGTYNWQASGGNPSSGTGSSFTVSYAAAGTYSVTVTSASQTATCTVTVTSAPPPSPIGGGSQVDVSIAPAGNQTSFGANAEATFRFTVRNSGPAVANNVRVGFWPQGAPPPTPDCQNETSATPPDDPSGDRYSTTISSLAVGASQDVSFTFNVGTTGASSVAYAGYDCNLNELSGTWGNNIAGQTYTISGGGGAWFKTTGGDVGAFNSNVSAGAPAGGWQSDYIIAAKSLAPSVQYQRWALTSYSGKMVPSAGAPSGSVYTFFASRFLETAKKTTDCAPAAGAAGLRYCGQGMTIGGLNLNNNTQAVWFVDGDLTVSGNVTVDSGSTAVFIVSGNINVGTNVTRADGVYIAGNTFRDGDSASPAGSQLVMDGAVYAKSTSLPRTCAGTCDNSTDPALVINFAPKYLITISDLLGSPSLDWREVEP